MTDDFFRFEVSARSRRNVRVYILADSYTGKWKISIYQAHPFGGKRLHKNINLNNEPIEVIFDLVKKEMSKVLEVLNEKRTHAKPEVSVEEV